MKIESADGQERYVDTSYSESICELTPGTTYNISARISSTSGFNISTSDYSSPIEFTTGKCMNDIISIAIIMNSGLKACVISHSYLTYMYCMPHIYSVSSISKRTWLTATIF